MALGQDHRSRQFLTTYLQRARIGSRVIASRPCLQSPVPLLLVVWRQSGLPHRTETTSRHFDAVAGPIHHYLARTRSPRILYTGAHPFSRPSALAGLSWLRREGGATLTTRLALVAIGYAQMERRIRCATRCVRARRTALSLSFRTYRGRARRRIILFRSKAASLAQTFSRDRGGFPRRPGALRALTCYHRSTGTRGRWYRPLARSRDGISMTREGVEDEDQEPPLSSCCTAKEMWMSSCDTDTRAGRTVFEDHVIIESHAQF